jgi:4-amino-4-deoxy-L-arabinose transferase-like glycosyltransferase
MIAVAIIALGARAVTAVALGGFTRLEVWEEGEIAIRVAQGQPYGYEWYGTFQHAFRAPAYTYLLAFLYAIFGTHAIVPLALNALLGATTALGARAAGASIGGASVGLIAGVLTATHPGLLVYSTKVHQLSLDAALIAALVAVIVMNRTLTLRSAVGLGLLTGLLGLSRPTALPFVALMFGAWILTAPGAARTATVRNVVAACALATMLTGGWIVRNWVVTGTPTLSTGTGVTLWIGHNPNATGSTTTAAGRPMLDADPLMIARIHGRPETQQDRIFLNAALAHIAEDPVRAVRTIAERVVQFWWFGPNAGLRYPSSWTTAYAAYYVAALGSFLVGLYVAWRRARWGPSVIALALITTSVAQAVFYVDGRHRWGVEAALLTLSAVGLAWLSSISRPKRQRA